MSKITNTKESGNAIIIVLAVVVVVAVGALGYFAMNKKEAVNAAEPASGSEQAQKGMEIKEGNPVVAKVNDKNITRSDVLAYIQQLPENVRQQPIGQLFPAAQEQVINGRVIDMETAKVDLNADPEVQAQVERAKKEIIKNIYVQREVAKRVTEDSLKSAYNTYKENFPKVEERKARHILVDSEEKARDALQKVMGGADFEALAKEISADNASAAQGGDVGYFAKSDVVAEFAEAAFATPVGEITSEPVQTQFGYHVIKVEDSRQRPVPPYEQVKPLLEVQLRQAALNSLVQDWKDKQEIVRYDINGEPIEPAAGE